MEYEGRVFDDASSSCQLLEVSYLYILLPLPPRLDMLKHDPQTNFTGTSSRSSIPEHLVCFHTPHLSHVNILSPSSSLVPQVQSTVQLSVPLSIRNCSNLHPPPKHLPRT
ncbi:hypothetical protein C4D60_Mb10t18710 [Musa balbisiana]|uniref:Uncharacterized protein n=1 Tax=Musa balbisiana TaxID=52838 RepID=A0A4V4H4X9_MUSBA|nr:hypothetical protein C4D60_Mb10t18710 [Musa balbisiana]